MRAAWGEPRGGRQPMEQDANCRLAVSHINPGCRGQIGVPYTGCKGRLYIHIEFPTPLPVIGECVFGSSYVYQGGQK